MLAKALLDAFSRSYDPPHWVVEDLQHSDDPEIRAAVNEALEAIPTSAVNELDDDTHATLEVTFSNRDPQTRARLHLLARSAAKALHQIRMEEINATAERPKPYDLSVLSDVHVDREGLVPLSAFDIEGDALCHNGHAFFILPAVPPSNANYWLLRNIQRHGLVGSVSVRLDPLLHGPQSEVAGRFYKMLVYGPPLDWHRIRSLRDVEQGRWMPGKLSTRSLFTDYAWVPHDQEVDFLCEELPTSDEVDDRSARYLHAVFDKVSNRLTHLDGAVRVYTAMELAARSRTHVRNAGKAGRRVKVFRTDRPIETSTMSDVVQAFFVWNYDVARYFGSPVPADMWPALVVKSP
jgi:hypothetical protein